MVVVCLLIFARDVSSYSSTTYTLRIPIHFAVRELIVHLNKLHSIIIGQRMVDFLYILTKLNSKILIRYSHPRKDRCQWSWLQTLDSDFLDCAIHNILKGTSKKVNTNHEGKKPIFSRMKELYEF